ncbi:acyl-CoA dehydrogenase [Roseomonas sp. KE2513]|nr:acyl-CoA dehydrogenase [Roseomonas sp. KE2513]
MPIITAEAAEVDHDGAFPAGSVAALREAGLLAAPLATRLGGQGWGLEPDASHDTATALRLIGRANLPLGRLFEGHVNALRLVQRRGSPAALRLAAEEAHAGLLFGVWNTEAPGEASLILNKDGALQGRKIFCSGAGHVARALVTARNASDLAAPPIMVLAPLGPEERADLSPWSAQGMRASATGTVDFTGLVPGEARLIGDRPPPARLGPTSGATTRLSASGASRRTRIGRRGDRHYRRA